jgi:uncharacterized membrane-anchored protein YhcB (DUF1043 family)
MQIARVTWTEIALGAALLLVGLLIGVFAARPRGDVRRRIRQLEDENEQLRAEGETYRKTVATHFSEASEKFRDLTREYTGLYQHLAAGARALCGDQPAIHFDRSALLTDERQHAESAPPAPEPPPSTGTAAGQPGDAAEPTDTQRDDSR